LKINKLQYIPAGDSAMIIKLGNDISPTTNLLVQKILLHIEQQNINGLVELVPAYNDLLVCYNPERVDYNSLIEQFRLTESYIEDIVTPEATQLYIPVLYGGETGPDLEEVAWHCGLSTDEVIQRHTTDSYVVYMLGFAPGFCYLGGMDEQLTTPRKKEPRLHIPAGSVGIAGVQTGVYSIDSPGGWQIIGQTPLKLFNPQQQIPFLIKAGDRLHFYAIDKDAFLPIKNAFEAGDFNPETPPRQ
jgi:inhibitor of KinA